MIVESRTDFQTLSFLKSYRDNIPDRPGVYYWVFWPTYDIARVTRDTLLKRMRSYSEVHLHIGEDFVKHKFSVHVEEASPGSGRHSGVFGLSEERERLLTEYMDESQEHIQQVAEFFKRMCFARPFYVGKADNLFTRLGQHFDEKSHLLQHLRREDFSFSDVWIGWEEIVNSDNPDIARIIEEIAQRIVKPGLSIRFG